MSQKIIAVTGTIGTGKSTAAGMLKSLGGKNVLLLDADRIAKKFLKRGGESAGMIAQLFPDAVDKSGKIDTRKLADAVFSSKTKLSMLNSLIHPFVIRAIKQKLEKFREKFVVLDIPLVIEADMLGIVDKLIIVNADKSAVIKRSKFSRKEIERRSSNQMPFEEKKKHAIKKLGDKNVFVVDNSSGLKKTREQVKSIWNAIAMS